MKQKHKKFKIIFLIACVVFLVYTTANLVWSNNILTYSNYTIESSKIKGNIRFVMVSDTEGKVFGKNNIRLIEKIENAKPEIVFILGDMVEKTTGDYRGVLSLCKALAKNYPVFYTVGNHENDLFSNKEYKSKFISDIEKTGAKILINSLTTCKTKSGDNLTIAGLRQFPFFEFDAPDYDNEENHLFQEYLAQEDNSHLSILLCHCPEAYMWGLENYNIDLMLSGHTHGGVIRLPFIGGLYAPEQGWFPQYDKGRYQGERANMLISAGLSVSSSVPRFNNPPDVAVAELTPKAK